MEREVHTRAPSTEPRKYKASCCCLRVSAVTREGAACLEVRDSGVGLTPEQQAHVLDRFRRADATRALAVVCVRDLPERLAERLLDERRGLLLAHRLVGRALELP